jgi:hypothetical protein
LKIPVFVSVPTTLTPDQDATWHLVEDELDRLDLEACTLGLSAYPTKLPLQEVAALARHCSGGIILGFEQFRITNGVAKPGTPQEAPITNAAPMPTPWNQLEAGILFGLGVPLLVFKEDGITGGVFDYGVTDVFVHSISNKSPDGPPPGFRDVFTKRQADVRLHYYRV